MYGESSQYHNDDIKFMSIREDLRTYDRQKLWDDLHAGLTTALVAVPQAMAFAFVAGLPLSCGLFAAIFSSILSALFGSCRHLSVGPNNMIAVLIQFGTAEILHNSFRGVVGAEKEMIAVMILTQLTLLIGIFQIGAALFRLGRLTQFVSLSVIVGYQGGVAVALVVNQLFTFFQVPSPQDVNSIFGKMIYFFAHLNEMHPPALFVGIFSLLLLLVLNRWDRKIPKSVVMLVASGLLVHFFGMSGTAETSYLGFQEKVQLVGDTAHFHWILPTAALPYFNFSLMNQLLPMAFAISLLSMVETTMIAKSMSSNTGQRLYLNQEILGLGIANFFASFFSAMPSSGSFARSSLLRENGGKTHFAAAFNGLWVWLIVVVFSFFLERTPLTALSAILLLASLHIVKWKQFLICLKATTADSLVLLVTFTSCLLFGLDVAFYAGVLLSVTLYLKKAAVPYIVECTFDDSGEIGHKPKGAKHPNQHIRVLNVQGELFFGAADLFQNMLKSVAKDDENVQVIILRMKNARDLDASSCLALQQLHHYLKGSGRHLLACGLSYATWEVLCNSGTVDEIGKENLFVSDVRYPRLSLKKALKRARELVRESREETASAHEEVLDFAQTTKELPVT